MCSASLDRHWTDCGRNLHMYPSSSRAIGNHLAVDGAVAGIRACMIYAVMFHGPWRITLRILESLAGQRLSNEKLVTFFLGGQTVGERLFKE
jgi:hypothetical protein